MAKLAIKGHHKRGDEVITTLEMLGGKNNYNLNGDKKYAFYTIDINDVIRGVIYIYNNDKNENIVYFTLEEFEDKFPYKVGDKVETIYGKIGIVDQLIWCNLDNAVRYLLEYDADSLYFANELQPCKEETMEEKIEAFEILESHCKDEVKIEFDPSKFEIVERENGYYVVRKKPKYPKTYEECCEIMGIDVSRTIEHDNCPFYKDVTCYEYVLLSSLVHLRKLLICRDAYWKIAGEQMGLDKPWEPDLGNEELYCVYNYWGQVIKANTTLAFNKILIFPTEEMRDAFYENFKDLIEKCKELL